MKFEIKLDTGNLASLADAFPKVGQRALNRVARSARSMASREIRDRYNIKKSDLDPKMSVRLASVQNLEAAIKVQGKRLPLILFSARPTKKGVRVMVRKGNRYILPSSFIATMTSGHKGVFTRTSEKRLPIKEHYRISVAEMFGSSEVMARMNRYVNERLPIEFHQQLKYELSK